MAAVLPNAASGDYRAASGITAGRLLSIDTVKMLHERRP
jgi:phenolic acid decarboxylase